MIYNLKIIITSIILLLFISSCGFKPMLAKNSSGYNALKEVRVISVEGPNQLKTKSLVDEVFDNNLSKTPKYDLKISINYSSFSMGVMRDSQITRYRIIASFHYKLIDIETQKLIDSSVISSYGSYDSAESDFANYIAERSVKENLVVEISKDLKARLSLIISDLDNK